VAHRVWRIHDMSVILQVRDKMQEKKLIIADGHHRYETALTYRNERRAQELAKLMGHGRSGQASVNPNMPFEYLMMTFVNMYSDGLLVLPTHRLVHSVEDFSTQTLLSRAAEFFEVKESPLHDVREFMQELQRSGEGKSTLAIVLKDSSWILHAKEEVIATADRFKEYSESQKKLDVLRLHKLLLEGALGISEQAITDGKHLVYLRSHEEGIERVRTGKDGAQAIFLMNPVTMDQMQAVAFEGNVMPQKSTDFYPKLMSGITLQSVE